MKTKVLITMEGGLIQYVSANQDVSLYVMDYDVEDADEEDIFIPKWPQADKCYAHSLGPDQINPELMDSIAQQIEAHEKRNMYPLQALKDLPEACPFCGAEKDAFICNGLQYTHTDIETVNDKDRSIIPSELDSSDWSIAPQLIICGICERILFDDTNALVERLKTIQENMKGKSHD